VKFGSRTKDNLIVSSTVACEGARLIIFGITVSIGAPILEESGKSSCRTASRIATVFIGFEDSAWVVATTVSLQLRGTLSVDVSIACYAT